MKFIVIDDERTFSLEALRRTIPEDLNESDVVEHYRNSTEGLAGIARHMIDYEFRYGQEACLFLDHDLGLDDTIVPVVDFLVCGSQPRLPHIPGIDAIFIHSQNPTSERYVNVLARIYGEIVYKIPLPS